MEYSLNEYCDMYLILGACNGREAVAAREYALRYPARRHPDKNVIRRLDQRMRENGTVMPVLRANAGRPRTVRTPKIEEAVLATKAEYPRKSARSIARRFGISHETVHKILNDDRHHPYRQPPAKPPVATHMCMVTAEQVAVVKEEFSVDNDRTSDEKNLYIIQDAFKKFKAEQPVTPDTCIATSEFVLVKEEVADENDGLGEDRHLYIIPEVFEDFKITTVKEELTAENDGLSEDYHLYILDSP